MIENEQQYETTKECVEGFEQRLMADIDIPDNVDIRLLNAERQAMREQLRELRCELANYEARRCSCSGTGKKEYPNTSGWFRDRGGWGGQAFTFDICDECWGSGDRNRPFRNLKR